MTVHHHLPPDPPRHGGDDPIAARWRAMLLATLVANALLGALLVLAPSLARAGFATMLYGDSGRLNTLGADAVRYIDLLHAVLGSVLIGWSVLMAAVVRGPLTRGDAWALPALGWAFLAWFLPDTTVSLASGHAPNAVLNAVFAVGFGVPWLALRRRQARGG